MKIIEKCYQMLVENDVIATKRVRYSDIQKLGMLIGVKCSK